jgi:hypothetical protein
MKNKTGSFNTGPGPEALFSNTTGNDNTATGFRSGQVQHDRLGLMEVYNEQS